MKEVLNLTLERVLTFNDFNNFSYLPEKDNTLYEYYEAYFSTHNNVFIYNMNNVQKSWPLH